MSDQPKQHLCVFSEDEAQGLRAAIESGGGSGNRPTAWSVINAVLTLLIPVVMVVGGWMFNQMMELRDWKAQSVVINAKQDSEVSKIETVLSAIPDRVVPAAFKEDFQQFRADMKQELGKMSLEISELRGVMQRHTEGGDRPKSSASVYNSHEDLALQ
jgi:hypothetical protein